MIRLITSFLCLLIISANAQDDIKLKPLDTKIVTFILPDGSLAKNTTVKLSTHRMHHREKKPISKAQYKTNQKGEIDLTDLTKVNESDFIFKTFIFDVTGYALHIQAFSPLDKIQLIKDQGVDGILVDKKGKPFKQTKIRVSQSIGLIWGQITIPKDTNMVTTNAKGEFTMRQMVLNNADYTCIADIVFADDNTDDKVFDWKYTFYNKDAKKTEKRIQVVKSRGK